MRTRPLKPSFCKNETIAEVDFGCRLLLQGLWMLADRNGRLEHRPKKIKAEVFPHDDAKEADVDNRLNALTSKGLINTYEVKGRKFIQIPNFAKHARPHKDEAADDAIPEPMTETGKLPANPEEAAKTSGEPENLSASCPVSCILSPVSGLPIDSVCPSEPEKNVIHTPEKASPSSEENPKPVPEPRSSSFSEARQIAKRLAERYRVEVTSEHAIGSATHDHIARIVELHPGITEKQFLDCMRNYRKHAEQCGKNKFYAPVTFFKDGYWEAYLDGIPPPANQTETADSARRARIAELVKKGKKPP